MITAGKQHNVIPETAEATIDLRICPSNNLKDIEEKLNGFMADSGVDWNYLLKSGGCPVSTTDPANFYWSALQEALNEGNIEYEVKIFPGGSDSRFYRSIGLSAYGISPFRDTPTLVHDHNEFLNSKVFLEGIDFYVKLIEKLAC